MATIFAMKSKFCKFSCLPPRIIAQSFNAVVEPILTYGTKFWWVIKKGSCLCSTQNFVWQVYHCQGPDSI